jgi:hypothetical protein
MNTTSKLVGAWICGSMGLCRGRRTSPYRFALAEAVPPVRIFNLSDLTGERQVVKSNYAGKTGVCSRRGFKLRVAVGRIEVAGLRAALFVEREHAHPQLFV